MKGQEWSTWPECMDGQTGVVARGGKQGGRAWGGGYLDVGVKLASSAVPEGVGPQLPVQAGHDGVAGGAVSVIKAVIGIQRRGAGGEVARRAWLVLRHIPCRPPPLCHWFQPCLAGGSNQHAKESHEEDCQVKTGSELILCQACTGYHVCVEHPELHRSKRYSKELRVPLTMDSSQPAMAYTLFNPKMIITAATLPVLMHADHAD